ncbi:armadillo-like helical domain-containing protein 4 isoform X2 [Megalops cyprinoides]|uniref:armadillo-like helical domain-containing protein 4 isoform X2 n=1 Tax=Megalops cyprinoides TaxID=118141 RepID=UPI00186514AF|nr:armadillo-like helical domain-containing protein 4 isoform X2 [Megalops cyprinoides]
MGSTPTSTSPDPGPTSASSETAGIEAGAGGEHPAMEGAAPRQGVKATATPEDLPLIFEPVDDALSEVTVTAPPSGTQQVSQFSVITAANGALSRSELESKVTVSRAPSLSEAPSPAMHNGPFLSWQMSGTEMMDTFSSSLLPSLTAPPPGPPPDYEILDSEEIGMIDTPTGTTKAPPNPFETQQPKTTVPPPLRSIAMATTLSLLSPKSGLEELEESEEEHDDEEEEDTTESEEGESKADSMEVTTIALMPPTYSHIPYHFHSGSVWVQRNQGLAHSWVEKIRDKVSTDLAVTCPFPCQPACRVPHRK